MYNISYSFPYILFFIYLFVVFIYEVSLNKGGNKKINIKIFIWTGYLLFFGFRGFVNTDCAGYYPFFEDLKTVWDKTSYSAVISSYDWEPGFITVIYLFKSFIPHYFVWTFTWTLIALVAVSRFLDKNVQYYSLGFLLFYIFGGYSLITNLMRGSIAFFLFLYSIEYLKKNDCLKYFLLNALGCLFHISSIIYLPLYFFIKKRIPIAFIVFSFLVVNILYFVRADISKSLLLLNNFIFVDSRLSLLLQAYIEGKQQSNLLSIGYLERTFTYLLVLLCYKKNTYQKGSHLIFLNSYILLYLIWYALWGIETAGQRISTLLIYSYWVFYADLYKMLKNETRKIAFIFLLFIYSISKCISGKSYSYHQYKNVLIETEDFSKARKRLQM